MCVSATPPQDQTNAAADQNGDEIQLEVQLIYHHIITHLKHVSDKCLY